MKKNKGQLLKIALASLAVTSSLPMDVQADVNMSTASGTFLAAGCGGKSGNDDRPTTYPRPQPKTAEDNWNYKSNPEVTYMPADSNRANDPYNPQTNTYRVNTPDTHSTFGSTTSTYQVAPQEVHSTFGSSSTPYQVSPVNSNQDVGNPSVRGVNYNSQNRQTNPNYTDSYRAYTPGSTINYEATTGGYNYQGTAMTEGSTSLSEPDLFRQLSPQARAIYDSLDQQGKGQARFLASQNSYRGNKNEAIKEAQRRMLDRMSTSTSTHTRTH